MYRRPRPLLELQTSQIHNIHQPNHQPYPINPPGGRRRPRGGGDRRAGAGVGGGARANPADRRQAEPLARHLRVPKVGLLVVRVFTAGGGGRHAGQARAPPLLHLVAAGDGARGVHGLAAARGGGRIRVRIRLRGGAGAAGLRPVGFTSRVVLCDDPRGRPAQDGGGRAGVPQDLTAREPMAVQGLDGPDRLHRLERRAALRRVPRQ